MSWVGELPGLWLLSLAAIIGSWGALTWALTREWKRDMKPSPIPTPFDQDHG